MSSLPTSVANFASKDTLEDFCQTPHLPGTVYAQFQNVPGNFLKGAEAENLELKSRLLSRRAQVEIGQLDNLRCALTPKELYEKMSTANQSIQIADNGVQHMRNTSIETERCPPATDTVVRSNSTSVSNSTFTARNASPQPVEGLESRMQKERLELSTIIDRADKFLKMLNDPIIDLTKLRKLSWHGIPEQMRPSIWQLLLGYLPASSDRRKQVLQSKRTEYRDYVLQTFGKGQDSLDQPLYRQIHVDVLRPQCKLPLFLEPLVVELFERVLYCWAIRHPASSYVQGINDLAVPFFAVFIVGHTDKALESVSINDITNDILADVEADTFWCLCKLLDSIQDNYTFAQPGIQRQVKLLEGLIERIDKPLADHLEREGVKFIQFAFRWMNCLLMRELTMCNIIRMWDTYFAEGTDSFFEFHLYVCAAFLQRFGDDLKRMDFQELMIYIQDLPTKSWAEDEIKMLLSRAFVLKSQFHNSPMHLKPV